MPGPSRSFRTQALILKRRSLGEADRLVTLLTPDHGKIDAVAKGARKPASKKTGHVELYTQADVLIARGRSLDILVQAEMVNPFLPLREDLSRGAYAHYVVELLDRLTYGGDDLDGLFPLLQETLVRLCEEDDIRRAVRYYELEVLDHTGFRPVLQECVITHEPLAPEDQYFSYEDGGVVSPMGARTSSRLVPLPLTTLKLLRHLQRSPYRQVASLRIPDAVHHDAERVMLGYVSHVLERRLQSVDFIRRIRQIDG